MTDPTIPTLVALSRKRPKPLALCCPHCGGDVVLRKGELWCVNSEREGLPAPAFKALAELEPKP